MSLVVLARSLYAAFQTGAACAQAPRPWREVAVACARPGEVGRPPVCRGGRRSASALRREAGQSPAICCRPHPVTGWEGVAARRDSRPAVSAASVGLKALQPARPEGRSGSLGDAMEAARGAWQGLLQYAGQKPAHCEAVAAAAGYRDSGKPRAGAESGDGWLCGTCGGELTTAGGLAAHRARKHGHTAPERAVVVDSVCPLCGVDFRTRRRARVHIRYGAAACRLAFADGAFGEAPPEAVAAADVAQAAEARAVRSAGITPGVGLPALLPPPVATAAAAAAPTGHRVAARAQPGGTAALAGAATAVSGAGLGGSTNGDCLQDRP